jgi:hypothetical protein
MNIIQQIYEANEDKTGRTQQVEELEQAIYNILQCHGIDKNGEISDWFFEALSCGQEAGFHNGFRTAIALLIESLT